MIQIIVDPGMTIVGLENLAVRMNELDEFVLMVGELVSQQMDYNFISSPWPPLAAATIAKKQAEGYPLDLLVRTGKMKQDAISGLWSASNIGSAARAVLDLPGYSAYHWEETRFMPARDFAFLPESFLRQIEGAFWEFMGDLW